MQLGVQQSTLPSATATATTAPLCKRSCGLKIAQTVRLRELYQLVAFTVMTYENKRDSLLFEQHIKLIS